MRERSRRKGISVVLPALVALLVAGEARAEREINCDSEGKKYRYCPVKTYGSARIQKRFSDAPCTHGKSWGYDAGGVWVDRGCRALFVVGEPGRRPIGGGGTRITCASSGGKREYCRADTRGYAKLEKQLSKSPCTLGYTWGYDDRGVWVDRGCRAEFTVGRSSGRPR